MIENYKSNIRKIFLNCGRKKKAEHITAVTRYARSSGIAVSAEQKTKTEN